MSRNQLIQALANPGFLPVFLGLLAGCASEPPRSPGPVQLPTYQNNAAYNKPYTVKGITYYPLASGNGYRETGLASWYGAESGNRTADGSRFNPQGFSAAHKTLPIPSRVRVTNLRNGRYVDVLINDRGPFSPNRLIDLSQGAAKQIGISGLTEVEVSYLAAPSGEE
ncbi:septal ring lytic transglycosylase RlpA family protein [Methylomonas sp. LW13]|uniref:septal ring lytic transglycosylase RlpA family protein n=1 Tax=unclassified Methylomonas TaxID=2608980 RepID=UPI00051BA115|nr:MULTISPECIES: septal ring lytic transglycosylase RlpA family protein [unclassified Methylomonas]PKD40221.1 septal ring lytic transglycosylase RlpA family protein [Methylomonas sp. Kb3]QBC29636.1 septal ring lytic transglycosylase RlpA family protein [Methylomonas sp. LW13]